MRYTTIFGIQLEVAASPDLQEFHARILKAASGREAEDLLYSEENPLHDPRHKIGKRPAWTADVLRSPEWGYLSDAVARAREQCGELDVEGVKSRARMTAAEAGAALGISSQAVIDAILRGELPGVKVGGVYQLSPLDVDAYTPIRATAGRTPRVPALFACAGKTEDGSSLTLVVRGRDGGLARAESRGHTDGVDHLVFPEWSEAVILWGRGDKARAQRVRPAAQHRPSEVRFGALFARGRWEAGAVENNRAEAADMFRRAKAEWSAEGKGA